MLGALAFLLVKLAWHTFIGLLIVLPLLILVTRVCIRIPGMLRVLVVGCLMVLLRWLVAIIGVMLDVAILLILLWWEVWAVLAWVSHR